MHILFLRNLKNQMDMHEFMISQSSLHTELFIGPISQPVPLQPKNDIKKIN